MTTTAPENRLRRGAGGRTTAFGAWITLGSPLVAEMCADGGFDFVCVDLQHGVVGRDALSTVLLGCGSSGATPLVRVGHLAEIGPALDLGAHGVIVPMVNTPSDAERAVRAAKYPPLGERSFGPTRARWHLNRDRTPSEVNDEVLCLAMIETPEGVASASRICAVPGLDGVYVGPSDLAVALGGTPGGDEGPAIRRAFEAVLDACSTHGTLAGVHAPSGAVAARRRAEGFGMVGIATDAAVLRAAYAAELAAAGDDHGRS
ncbi:HpcH/HpaI aldolase family protein [Actinomycetospora flava]|uniref:Aldolase/citrate lyase family protein n=1 Tax=Actinomycetospora flava TaxID=3129232 RepID=A0ABU8M8G5_9PSEU